MIKNYSKFLLSFYISINMKKLIGNKRLRGAYPKIGIRTTIGGEKKRGRGQLPGLFLD
ncbi:MAG: hypothetical protein GF329_01230 [Candidatus Lokiarchaeota archaeon]|nr:hypothetical protein [Candidatus Lokiarchaeota archaeon]